MTDLTAFGFHGQSVRVVIDEHGEPWFVAKDVLAILDLNRSSLVALDDDEKGVQSVYSPGGDQNVAIIAESGLYSLILRSRKNEARAFKQWILREVLPSIRKTGSYGTAPALTGPELMAAALIEAQATLMAHRAEVLELTPRAQAWDVMVSAGGDYAVDEAAKILSRDPNIEIGRTRLFALMAELGWIYRSGKRGRWHAYQTAIENGRLAERASAAFLNSRTGEMEAPAPTIRITPKGLDALRSRLIPTTALTEAS